MNIKRTLAFALAGAVGGIALSHFLPVSQRAETPEDYLPAIHAAFAKASSPAAVNIFATRLQLRPYIADEAEKAGYAVCSESEWPKTPPDGPVANSGFYNFIVNLNTLEESRKDREVAFMLLDDGAQLATSAGKGLVYCLKP